jgi:hypothetical protein
MSVDGCYWLAAGLSSSSILPAAVRRGLRLTGVSGMLLVASRCLHIVSAGVGASQRPLAAGAADCSHLPHASRAGRNAPHSRRGRRRQVRRDHRSGNARAVPARGRWSSASPGDRRCGSSRSRFRPAGRRTWPGVRPRASARRGGEVPDRVAGYARCLSCRIGACECSAIGQSPLERVEVLGCSWPGRSSHGANVDQWQDS